MDVAVRGAAQHRSPIQIGVDRRTSQVTVLHNHRHGKHAVFNTSVHSQTFCTGVLNMSHAKFRHIGTLAILLFAAARPAMATDLAPVLVANQIRVYYGDLNLHSPLAADLLVTRITQAAKQACGGRPPLSPGFFIMRERYVACLQQAEQTAIAAVNQPSVTAAYARKLDPAAERLATR
jgi:UrcA family protein